MKILIHSLTLVVAAVIGLAVGFAFRGKRGSPSTVVDSKDAVATTNSIGTTNRAGFSRNAGSVRAPDDSPLATKLERDLSMSSGVTRWLYWLEAIEKAAPSDFPRLARLAQGNPTAVKLLGARWVEIAPRHLFDAIVAAGKEGRGFPVGELTSVLFNEWPKRDPDAVIAALSETNSLARRGMWRAQVADIILGKDVERGLSLASQWNIGHYGLRTTAVAKWAAADPRHAAEFALAHPAGFASKLVMETIGKEWARSDPAGALEFAASRRDALGSLLAEATLNNWAGQDLAAAAKWLGAADATTRNRLSPALVEGWAKFDSAGALAWCEANLTSSSLIYSVAAVSKSAAESDVRGASALVANMKPSPARVEAAGAVAQQWFPYSPGSKAAPPEAIEWMTGLDTESRRRAIEYVYWRWSESDPKSLADFLATTDGASVSSWILSTFARGLARQDPAEALAWAGRLPPDRGLAAGSEAFGEWSRSRPESAMKWLEELLPTDARRRPFFQNAIQSLANGPQTQNPVLFASLNPADRAAAREIIGQLTLPEDRRAQMLDALKAR
jgi:hypothetical protein